MSFSDTSSETIGNLFFSQVRNLTISTAREKRKYSIALDSILSEHAPESSRLFRQRLQVYR